MIRELAVFERSSCRCAACSTPCTSGRPGALAPSDLDRIAEFFGLEDPTEEFIANNFVAAESTADEMPVIRPATRLDGACVFLSENGDCACHAVAPCECSRTRACDPADGEPAMRALEAAIHRSVDYQQTWKWLRAQRVNPLETEQ